MTLSMLFHGLLQVVNRLRKDYVYETLLNYGVQYDNTWIYDKIHHEINQFCSSHTLQQVYIDVFDQVNEITNSKSESSLIGNCNLDVSTFFTASCKRLRNVLFDTCMV